MQPPRSHCASKQRSTAPRTPLAMILALVSPRAYARADVDAPRTNTRDIAASVYAGTQLPIFFIYDRPGIVIGLGGVWPSDARLQLVADAAVGALAAEGLRRTTMVGSVGVRGWLLPGRLAAGFAVGGSAYRERIGIVLPAMRIVEYDVGAALTIKPGLTFVLAARWELTADFAFNALATGGMNYVGTAGVAIGRQL
jgi:hypothetical protein